MIIANMYAPTNPRMYTPETLNTPETLETLETLKQ